ncbi:MAG: non-hydrolyzing UDP-N-acetylglucosamine 2-epimerase [Planctomycetaceae bacterium]
MIASQPFRPLIVLGTRPEAIKLAPLILACQQHPQIVPIVCSTGQHREMLDQVLGYFEIKPEIDLGLMKPGQTLSGLTAACIESVDRVVVEQKPDAIVVQGDTTTVMASSMVGFYRRIPIVHVEAGLRTGDLMAPWPEEFNRRVTGIVTTLHCAPTQGAADALRREQVPESSIRVTGNTVIDALLMAVKRERGRGDQWLRRYPMVGQGPVLLVTGHRRENFGDGLAQMCDALRDLATAHRDLQIIYPVHLNPQVSGPVRERLAGLGNIHLMPPADYPEFVWLMDQATVVLTDSGGVQEEAPSLGHPVLVTRDKTERPEAIEAGLAELVGTNRKKIVTRVSELLAAPKSTGELPVNPYGDGKASARIVDWMLETWR